MEIRTRREALDAGEKYFFTGKPCKYGHLTERYVGNGGCLDCLRPKSTALVISTPGEIISPHSSLQNNERLEIQRSKIQIEQQKLILKARSQEIQQQKLQMTVDRREDRAVKEHRTTTVKSRLMNVNLLAHPLDYEQIGTIAWAAAFARDPLLRREDVVTGRKGCEKDDPIYVMKCFPEDREALLKVGDEIWSRRSAPRAERDRAEILAKVEAERAAKDEKDWPELNCK